MPLQQFSDQCAAAVIERRERFVEQPQRGAVEPEPCECSTALLSGRQLLAGREFVTRKADSREQPQKLVITGIGTHSLYRGVPPQIFERAQLRVEPAAMTDVTKRSRTFDTSLEVPGQARQTPQQRRLAAAVGTAQFDHVARPDIEVEIVEQDPTVALAAEPTSCE